MKPLSKLHCPAQQHQHGFAQVAKLSFQLTSMCNSCHNSDHDILLVTSTRRTWLRLSVQASPQNHSSSTHEVALPHAAITPSSDSLISKVGTSFFRLGVFICRRIGATWEPKRSWLVFYWSEHINNTLRLCTESEGQRKAKETIQWIYNTMIIVNVFYHQLSVYFPLTYFSIIWRQLGN